MRRLTWTTTLALTLTAAVGCKQGAEAPPKAEEAPKAASAEPAEKAEEPAEPAEKTEGLAPEGWTRLAQEELSEQKKAQLEEAQKAQQALASTLMGELKAAVGKGEWAKGIEACKNAAPKVKAKVSDEYDVKIGRTSFKVRNPDNAPSDWRVPFVEARVKEQVLLEGPEGQLGYMAPIMAGEVCMNCHGSAAQIPDDVEEMIAKAYPKDEATGFSAGDLRGWFWVEVADR